MLKLLRCEFMHKCDGALLFSSSSYILNVDPSFCSLQTVWCIYMDFLEVQRIFLRKEFCMDGHSAGWRCSPHPARMIYLLNHCISIRDIQIHCVSD